MNRISIIQGDITKIQVDAIVNAANSSLLGGGGVDGAIHQAAGIQLLEACRLLNGCKTGEAKITSGYNLQAKHVIHAVGPIWKGGNLRESQLLASCYRNCFYLAKLNKMESIAFPNISTGVYGYPKAEAANIVKNETLLFLADNPKFKKVIFAIFDEENYHIYNRIFNQLN
ncbi:MAG: O-acetyl-ADP-ribose deacetylase [Salinivirgaceae bacterium]|jgi:O-acetyl-ADP-ribose deacetylase (regulator of RNase III)